MINTERNVNKPAGGESATPPVHDKQLPIAPKKTALRDVQNENVGPVHKPQESLLLPGGGRTTGDTIKVCGTKRLTPERPSSSQGLPSLPHNGPNENVMNARRRFELELGRGRVQSNVEKISDLTDLKNVGQFRQEIAQKTALKKDSNPHQVTSNNPTANKVFPSNGPPIPSSLGKQSNSSAATKISPEVPRAVELKVSGDQLRAERFIRLQKYLKQCDEANQREYTQMLLHLPPPELSKHAVELEKRAIQLTIEEGNEMQRMKALNILAKPSPTNNGLLSTQLLQSSKR